MGAVCMPVKHLKSPTRSPWFFIFWLLLGCCVEQGQPAFAQTNGVLREVYYNLSGGGAVSELTNSAKFPNNPDEQFVDAAFEAPSNFADYYGQRMRARSIRVASPSPKWTRRSSWER